MKICVKTDHYVSVLEVLWGVSESSVPKERPVCPSLKPSGREVTLKVLSRRVPSADWKAAPGGAVEIHVD